MFRTNQNDLAQPAPQSSVWGIRLRKRARRIGSLPNRRLLIELVRADFRANEHNAILGVLWSLISPLFLLAVMYVVFKGRFGQGIQAYGVYLLVGIVIVGFFTLVTKLVLPIFVASKTTFLNSTMPKETFIAAIVVMQLYNLGIELLFCVVLSLTQGVFSPWFLVFVWPLLLALTAFATGVGLVLALLYSTVRDTEHVWNMAMRLLLFVTPVFYQLDALPTWAARAVYWLNPLTPFVIAFRQALMGEGVYSPFVYVHAVVLGVVFLVAGYALFIKYEFRAVERA